MRELHLTQSDLAKAVGMSQSGVSDWFNPIIRAMPDGETMLLLPRVLGVNGHWLLTGQGPKEPLKGRTRDEDLVEQGLRQGAESVITEVRNVLSAAEQRLLLRPGRTRSR